MSTTPPTAPAIDTEREDGIYAIRVQEGRRDLNIIRQWQGEVVRLLNSVDVGAAAGANAELQANAAPDMALLSDLNGMLEHVNNWIQVNSADFASLWNDDTAGPSAADRIAEFLTRMREAIGVMSARGCWGVSRDSQPSVAGRLRTLLGNLRQLEGLPLGNAGTSRQVVQRIMSGVAETVQAMEAESQRRPSPVAPNATRTIGGAVAQRYLTLRATLGGNLNTLARHELWDRADLASETPTVGTLARQLAADLDTRIVLIPGAGENQIQVSDPNAILIALNRLIERMERECDKDRPENATMRKGTEADEQYLTAAARAFYRRQIYRVLAVAGLSGAALLTWYLSSGTPEPKEKPGLPPSALKTPVAAKNAPRDVIEGCTIVRNGGQVTLTVPPGRNTAYVFVSGGAIAKQQIGTNLRAGNHTLDLPAALASAPVTVHVRVNNGADWVNAPDIDLP